eukprot:2035989-Rhodomonas_salina.3
MQNTAGLQAWAACRGVRVRLRGAAERSRQRHPPDSNILTIGGGQAWVSILEQVPGSVLVLPDHPAGARVNVERRAAKAGLADVTRQAPSSDPIARRRFALGHRSRRDVPTTITHVCV